MFRILHYFRTLVVLKIDNGVYEEHLSYSCINERDTKVNNDNII